MENEKPIGHARVAITGGKRDSARGKGRFDLVPMRELALLCDLIDTDFFSNIDNFEKSGDARCLMDAAECVLNHKMMSPYQMSLELAKHFERGAEHYGVDNWKQGLPISWYIDSACRHYCKYMSGWADEPHDVACVWNLICAHWTMENMPQMDDYTKKISTKID